MGKLQGIWLGRVFICIMDSLGSIWLINLIPLLLWIKNLFGRSWIILCSLWGMRKMLVLDKMPLDLWRLIFEDKVDAWILNLISVILKINSGSFAGLLKLVIYKLRGSVRRDVIYSIIAHRAVLSHSTVFLIINGAIFRYNQRIKFVNATIVMTRLVVLLISSIHVFKWILCRIQLCIHLKSLVMRIVAETSLKSALSLMQEFWSLISDIRIIDLVVLTYQALCAGYWW